jgi:hypothetical protein
LVIFESFNASLLGLYPIFSDFVSLLNFVVVEYCVLHLDAAIDVFRFNFTNLMFAMVVVEHLVATIKNVLLRSLAFYAYSLVISFSLQLCSEDPLRFSF